MNITAHKIQLTLERTQFKRKSQNLNLWTQIKRYWIIGFPGFTNSFLRNREQLKHHSIESKYLEQYLAKCSCKFNRHHDSDSLFFRTLEACVHATPRTQRSG